MRINTYKAIPVTNNLYTGKSCTRDREICRNCPADFCWCPRESSDVAGHFALQVSIHGNFPAGKTRITTDICQSFNWEKYPSGLHRANVYQTQVRHIRNNFRDYWCTYEPTVQCAHVVAKSRVASSRAKIFQDPIKCHTCRVCFQYPWQYNTGNSPLKQGLVSQRWSLTKNCVVPGPWGSAEPALNDYHGYWHYHRYWKQTLCGLTFLCRKFILTPCSCTHKSAQLSYFNPPFQTEMCASWLIPFSCKLPYGMPLYPIWHNLQYVPYNSTMT